MAKKNNERSILHLVYDEREFSEIIESEQPDFQIRHKMCSSFFGVEVTEFYYSESNARLQNIPNYFNEIIFEDRYRHKSDMIAIRAEEVKVISSEGSIREVTRGIVQEFPKYEDYAGMIADVIESKGRKFSGYDKKLDHINLIIFDTEQLLQAIPTDQFYTYFYTPRLRDSLFNSHFREVFLITILNNDRHVLVQGKRP